MLNACNPALSCDAAALHRFFQSRVSKSVEMQGYTELLELLAEHRRSGGAELDFDIFGSGENMPDIKQKAKSEGLNITFHDGVDHLDDQLKPFRWAP